MTGPVSRTRRRLLVSGVGAVAVVPRWIEAKASGFVLLADDGRQSIARLHRRWQHYVTAWRAAPEASAEALDLRDEWLRLERQIAVTPAASVADLRAKVSFYRENFVLEDHSYSVASEIPVDELMLAGLLEDVDQLVMSLQGRAP